MPVKINKQIKHTNIIFNGFNLMIQITTIIFNQAVTIVTTLLQFH